MRRINQREIPWPHGAQAAAMVTVELDGELIWTALGDTTGYDYNTPKNLSMGSYGALRGLDRMLDSLARDHIPATFFVPGRFAQAHPDLLRQIDGLGHEIAAHGHSHRDFAALDEDGQRRELSACLRAITQAVGKRPTGFRLPEGGCTGETFDLLSRLGMLYDSSLFHHDIPFLMTREGWPTGMVEIPMRWELQDFPYFAFGPCFPYGGGRIAVYDDVLENWLCELDACYDSGYCYVIKFDPQTIGSPGRMYLFDRVLQRITQRNIWAATGSEIAYRVLGARTV